MGDRVCIEIGEWEDYRALRAGHYEGGDPAAPVRVLRAAIGGELAGVLVVAMPTLNGWWRARAWPASGVGDRRARAAWLNAHVRRIARVIVDPRLRGMGVGAALVRAYLAEPLTDRCEAVAAMGLVCPIFERAGMRRVQGGERAEDRRLRRLLRGAGIDPVWLADVRAARNAAADPDIRRWIDAWASGGRRTGAPMERPAWERAARAGRALGVRAAVYVWP